MSLKKISTRFVLEADFLISKLERNRFVIGMCLFPYGEKKCSWTITKHITYMEWHWAQIFPTIVPSLGSFKWFKFHLDISPTEAP